MHIFLARGFVRHGEIVAHAGAADADAVHESGPLQVVYVLIGRHLGITGEVVSGRVQGVDPMLRAEMDGIREGHAALAQGPVERVSVQSEFELDSRFPRDPGWRGDGGRGHQAAKGHETQDAGRESPGIRQELVDLVVALVAV